MTFFCMVSDWNRWLIHRTYYIPAALTSGLQLNPAIIYIMCLCILYMYMWNRMVLRDVQCSPTKTACKHGQRFACHLLLLVGEKRGSTRSSLLEMVMFYCGMGTGASFSPARLRWNSPTGTYWATNSNGYYLKYTYLTVQVLLVCIVYDCLCSCVHGFIFRLSLFGPKWIPMVCVNIYADTMNVSTQNGTNFLCN